MPCLCKSVVTLLIQDLQIQVSLYFCTIWGAINVYPKWIWTVHDVKAYTNRCQSNICRFTANSPYFYIESLDFFIKIYKFNPWLSPFLLLWRYIFLSGQLLLPINDCAMKLFITKTSNFNTNTKFLTLVLSQNNIELREWIYLRRRSHSTMFCHTAEWGMLKHERICSSEGTFCAKEQTESRNKLSHLLKW